MAFRIAVDTGGTFTDVALSNDSEIVGIFKAPTTPADMFEGIYNSLEQASQYMHLSVADLLAQTQFFVYATTRSTNAIIEHEILPPAFLTTKGHRDILLYREAGKPEPWNLRLKYPEPFVPRWLTFEVTERILADGTVDKALDDDEVRKIASRLLEIGARTVGVCLLWSSVNPAHELRIGELLHETVPEVEVTLSHQVNPIIREYRRAVATVIDASLKPLMRQHLQDIDGKLRSLGFNGQPLMVTHASGGVLGFEEMSERPIHTIDSGPAIAPIAGLTYTQLETADRNVIVIDAGGTSFDVSLIRDLSIGHTPSKWLGREWLSDMTGMSAVDTRSIGAGGGSIAWVDPGGLLHVGPNSAGAVPGPACYGQSGIKPTVTDCALALGLINPDYFLGGRVKLNPDLATAAIEKDVAQPLGRSVQDAAEDVLKVAGDAMTNLIREITVNQGVDPRTCLLVAGGGASGLNVVSIARELECKTVLIPRLAAALSAVGGLFSDLFSEFTVGHFSNSQSFDALGVNAVLIQLANSLKAFFQRSGGSYPEVRQFFVDARYAYQAWELEVPLGEKHVLHQEDVGWLVDHFHAVHERTFAVRDPEQTVEFLNWRARGWKQLPKPSFPTIDSASGRALVRSVYLDRALRVVKVYRGGQIARNRDLRGPLIVEEPTTTIVVPIGARLKVTPLGNYLIDTGA